MTSAIEKIKKRYGKQIVSALSERPSEIEVLSSGIMSLDHALNIPLPVTAGEPAIGGFPRGRITELYGPYGGGKTSIALHHLAEVAKLGGMGAYIDVEQKASPLYFKEILKGRGVDPSSVYILTPPNAEATFEIVRDLMDEADSIVIDSIAELTTQSQMDAKMGERQPGVLARIVKDGIYRSGIGISQTCLVAINQVRDVIGGYGYERQPGGHSLKHKSILRVRVSSPGGPIKKNGKKVGVNVKCVVHKNQIGCPWGSTEFNLYWSGGVKHHEDLVDLGIELGVIEQNGSWYTIPYENDFLSGGETIQGTIKVYDLFKGYADRQVQLRQEIGKHLRSQRESLLENLAES